MIRISSGLTGPDLALQRNLFHVSGQLQQVTGRLATLSRINSGADDPAGLIGSELIRAELAAIEAADRNAAYASATIAVADGALSQVSGLLNTIEGAFVATAGGGLSSAETAAYQVEVDAAVEAIDRIGAQTNLSGQRLLDGSTSELAFLFAPNPADTVTLALPTVAAAKLGNDDGTLTDLTSGGSLALATGEQDLAKGVLQMIRDMISQTRGSLGAFERYTIEASQEVSGGLRTFLSRAFSSIADADVAVETASLVQLELIQQSAFASVRVAGERFRLAGLLLDKIQ